MPETKVIDLSSTNKIPESLKPAREAGVIGMVHQLTCGTDVPDSKAEARVFLAKDAGMLIGLSHVMTDESVTVQVNNFVGAAKSLGLEDNWLLAVVYDDVRVKSELLVDFLEEVEKQTRRSPVFYCPALLLKNLKQDRKLSNYRLWLAQHDSAAEVPLAWGNFFLWQYTEEGEVDGVNPPVGCSHFVGSDETLGKLWSGFKGKTDREVPEGEAKPEPDSGTAPVEPTMTPEGELDNAPAESQPTPPEVTDNGELDKPAEGSEHPPETIDNTLPTTPSTPDNSLPDAQPDIDNSLPSGAPARPDNTLPTTPSPKKK